MSQELLKIFSGSPTKVEEEVNVWRNSGKISIVGEPMLSTTSALGDVQVTVAFFYVEKANGGKN